MNHWRQSKRYRCPACGTVYLHDQAYQHAAFKCPARPVVQRPVLIEKTYEPKAGR